MSREDSDEFFQEGLEQKYQAWFLGVTKENGDEGAGARGSLATGDISQLYCAVMSRNSTGSGQAACTKGIPRTYPHIAMLGNP